MTPDSIHIIADLSGCAPEMLELASVGEKLLSNVVAQSGLNCVSIKSHQFEPRGYTAVALLTESHITLHTWPEYNSVQVDIFTCGIHDKAKKAYEVLKAEFKPERFADRVFYRTLDKITVEGDDIPLT